MCVLVISIGLHGGWNIYNYSESNPVIYFDPTGEQGRTSVDVCIQRHGWKNCGGGAPTKPFKKPSPKKPKKMKKMKKGQWTCVVVACCRKDIPGNCPEDPKQWCKQGSWTNEVRGTAEKTAEYIAKKRLGCKTRHPSVTCWHPKHPTWRRGG